MGVPDKKRGQRFSVSLKDPDVAASFRDVGSQLGGASSIAIELSKTYTPPIVISCKNAPKNVVCGRAKSRAGTDYIAVSGIRWKWTSGKLTILDIPGLTVGQKYDINLLVVV